jgi:hypothetical protein
MNWFYIATDSQRKTVTLSRAPPALLLGVLKSLHKSLTTIMREECLNIVFYAIDSILRNVKFQDLEL